MFELTKLQINEELLKKVQNLIKTHNTNSYREVSLGVDIEHFVINKVKVVKDSACDELLEFYKIYMKQAVLISHLKEVIQSMSYTVTDLSIHIDRSQDSIVQILSSLSEIKKDLNNLLDEISLNHQLEEDLFIDYMKNLVSSIDSDSITNLITCIFKCIKGKGVISYFRSIDTMGTFMKIGYGIIAHLYKSNVLSNEQIVLIRDMTDKYKTEVLGLTVKDTMPKSELNTMSLQSFGITPDETDNVSMSKVLEILLGVKDVNINPSDTSFESVDIALKQYEQHSGITTGILIYVSSNEDNYFNISNLMSQTKRYESAGVTESMIKTFDLLRTTQHKRLTNNSLLKINIKESAIERTSRVFVLWTNDLKTFKYKSTPITILDKLVRSHASDSINDYNNLLFNVITDNLPSTDMISFNKLKLLSFNESMSESVFLDTAINKVVSMTSVVAKKHNLSNTFTFQCIDDLAVVIRDELYNMKPMIEIQPFSAHTSIIYLSMVSSIIKSLKKQLLNQSIDEETVKGIVDTVINSNDNIYSRTIASHYLHKS